MLPDSGLRPVCPPAGPGYSTRGNWVAIACKASRIGLARALETPVPADAGAAGTRGPAQRARRGDTCTPPCVACMGRVGYNVRAEERSSWVSGGTRLGGNGGCSQSLHASLAGHGHVQRVLPIAGYSMTRSAAADRQAIPVSVGKRQPATFRDVPPHGPAGISDRMPGFDGTWCHVH